MGTRAVTPKAYKYVNRMLNVIYLTGFVVESNREEGWFKVGQTINKEQDIVVHMEPGHSKIPAKRRMVTATCHVWGEQFVNPKTDGKETPEKLSGLYIRAIDVSQANILSIPSAAAYFGKARNRGKIIPKGIVVDEERIPYDTLNNLKPDIAETVEISKANPDESEASKSTEANDEEPVDMMDVIRKIIEASGGKFNTDMGQNANVVLVAGCVEDAYIRKGNEHSSKDRLEILLRQCDKTEEALFVRYEPDRGPAPQAYASRIKKGFPIKVLGEIRVKPILDEPGNVLGHHCYIRAREIYSAEIGTDIQALPSWWIEKSRLMTITDKREQQRRTIDAIQNNEPLPERDRQAESTKETSGYGW